MEQEDIIEVTLFDGTQEEIEKLICPVCGGKIWYEVSLFGLNYACLGTCGTFVREYGCFYEPNCIKYPCKYHEPWKNYI